MPLAKAPSPKRPASGKKGGASPKQGHKVKTGTTPSSPKLKPGSPKGKKASPKPRGKAIAADEVLQPVAAEWPTGEGTSASSPSSASGLESSLECMSLASDRGSFGSVYVGYALDGNEELPAADAKDGEAKKKEEDKMKDGGSTHAGSNDSTSSGHAYPVMESIGEPTPNAFPVDAV